MPWLIRTDLRATYQMGWVRARECKAKIVFGWQYTDIYGYKQVKNAVHVGITVGIVIKYYYNVTPWIKFLENLIGLLSYMPKKYTTLYGSSTCINITNTTKSTNFLDSFLILNFRRVLIVVSFLLGKSPASVY